MKIEIYSDIACPWCYIGDHRFEAALADLPGAEEIEVVYRPYQLDPAAPERPVPSRERLARRFGSGVEAKLAHVTGAAAAEGITLDWDRALSVNTRTAHRLARLAELEYGSGVQRALMRGLFAAHFTEGGDVSDHEQLTRIAVAAGMEEARVRSYLGSGEGTDELLAELEQARAIGVGAVPTFVFDGRYAVQGAQPAATFRQLLEELDRRSA